MSVIPFSAITDTVFLSVLRFGRSTLVAGGGETLHFDISSVVPTGVLRKYLKVVAGVMTEMTAIEMLTVDAALLAVNLADSVGAPRLLAAYFNEAALPVTPLLDYLVVGLEETGAGNGPGIALSFGGAWHIIRSGSDD